ncbi:MAG TPA: hypothetical protein VMV40_03195 [Acidiferrobacter sp.]|nr:hypothetical protein [Acidiferrobacter sp.]
MSAQPLTFDSGPPLGLVLRSFLIAPWFIAAAGLVLLLGGPQALSDRYTPSLLAATHLVTIGFLMVTASAAVFQLLPVLSGVSVRALTLIAPIVQFGFVVGAVVLAFAFMSQRPFLFDIAAALLAAATSAFIVPTWITLRGLTEQKTLLVMRYALTGLAVGLTLGLTMAVQRGTGRPLSVYLLVMHPLWALVGGLFILWAGVALQVMPMFQGARSWSVRATLWLGPVLLALLTGVLWAVARGWPQIFARVGLLAIAGVVALYGALVLHRLWTRGRRRRDVMTYFWYLALACLLFVCWLAVPLIFVANGPSQYPLLLGVVSILGVGVSFMSGMLYKIVPFLVWLHLQRRPGHAPVLLQTIIEERWMMLHFGIHVAALWVTLLAIFWPRLWTMPAAVLWICAGSGLGLNLASAGLRYRRALRPLLSS